MDRQFQAYTLVKCTQGYKLENFEFVENKQQQKINDVTISSKKKKKVNELIIKTKKKKNDENNKAIEQKNSVKLLRRFFNKTSIVLKRNKSDTFLVINGLKIKNFESISNFLFKNVKTIKALDLHTIKMLIEKVPGKNMKYLCKNAKKVLFHIVQ